MQKLYINYQVEKQSIQVALKKINRMTICNDLYKNINDFKI